MRKQEWRSTHYTLSTCLGLYQCIFCLEKGFQDVPKCKFVAKQRENDKLTTDWLGSKIEESKIQVYEINYIIGESKILQHSSTFEYVHTIYHIRIFEVIKLIIEIDHSLGFRLSLEIKIVPNSISRFIIFIRKIVILKKNRINPTHQTHWLTVVSPSRPLVQNIHSNAIKAEYNPFQLPLSKLLLKKQILLPTFLLYC